ncbi:hypothetical protein Egran_06872 [Elaphomyces granulatus]|uniref:D-isomer specific 2-hydroxyacid dehydrogenase NAD-binding domain-containing protein n=1 Tax=Elaphomyces granulatus TaxID=519963 RepID=A0A232LMH2_9EURO|nr:hypothetical protein Egran_06872 [Elaphomyces granulatus]
MTFNRESLLIATQWEEPKDNVADIRQSFPDIEVNFFKAPPGRWELGADTIPKDLLERATIIGTLLHVPKPDQAPNNVTITTSSGIHGPPIAEWTLMNWTVSSQKYNATYEAQKRHEWLPIIGTLDTDDHLRKSVSILGYGSIGRQSTVARVAAAMGMTIHAYTALTRSTPESRRDTGYSIPETGDPEGALPVSWHHGTDKASLHEFLSLDLDHVVIALPLTSQTIHLLGAEEFSVLSSHCTTAARRTSGELSGAALDVTDPEPLPADHPLWDEPKVQISPHISGFSRDYFARCLDVLKVNLGHMQRREKLINVYRHKRGY